VWLTEIYQRLAKDVKSSQGGHLILLSLSFYQSSLDPLMNRYFSSKDAIDNGKYVQEAMLSYMRQIKEWETVNPESGRLG